MEKKSGISKNIKMYLVKQLKKIPGLKINNIINAKRLTSILCKYPKAHSIDMRTTTNHKTDLAAIDRYLQEHFPSLDINDDESSSPETSTKPSSKNRADFSPSTSNSLVAPSSTTDDTRDVGETAVPVVTISTDPCNDFKRTMKTMLETSHQDNSQKQEMLEELAVIYVNMNESRMHKHVIKAFSDITREICESSFRYEQENANGNYVEKGRESD